MQTPPTDPPRGHNPSYGVSTYLGVAVTVLGGVAAVVAGAEGNDTATATGGAVAALAALGTIGGRVAQVLVMLRSAARVAEPWIDAAQDALRHEPRDTTPSVVELDYEDPHGP